MGALGVRAYNFGQSGLVGSSEVSVSSFREREETVMSVLRGSVLPVLVGLVAVIMITPAMAQQVEFTPLGVECGPAFFPVACVVDMSGDGSTILYRRAIWTADGGMQPIGGPAGGFEVRALSDDGSTVVGNVYVADSPLGPHVEAAIWLGGDQWQALGGLEGATPCGTSFTSAYDVTGDGSKVVGLAWLSCTGAHAFEWTEEGGMVDLGSIVEGRSSRANAVSADGSMIVGWSDTTFGSRRAAYWDAGAPAAWFEGEGSPIFVGAAQNTNSDGSVIVGGNWADNSDPLDPAARRFEPWMWTADSGVVPLGTAKGLRGDVVDGQHFARDVSDAGDAVVGQVTLFQLGEQWAFLWTAGGGMSMLQDYVREHSDPATAAQICTAERGPYQPCSEWDFWNTSAISNDGKIIVGTGRNPDGNLEAFKVTLP